MCARRRARECALQLLFQTDISHQEMEAATGMFWNLYATRDYDRPATEEVRRYADFLVRGTIGHKEEIDQVIQKFSEHWRIERMAAVDRNILRLAVFEFLHEKETPTTVVINEALEIARKYSTEESTQFINGILDAINKNFLPPSRPQAPTQGSQE